MNTIRITSEARPLDDDQLNLDAREDRLELEGEGKPVEDDELDLDDEELPVFDTKGGRHTGNR